MREPSDDGRRGATEPVVITGAALGLPGAERLFDDANIGRLLDGRQGIDVIPARLRREMLDKHVDAAGQGRGRRRPVRDDRRLDEVIKLAARAGAFDLGEEFGVDAERLAALGRDTQLAIAAGIDALRDAGIPLVLHYKTTTHGDAAARIAGRCPKSCATRRASIFASAFPGLEEMADEVDTPHGGPDAPGASRRARVAARADARPRRHRRRSCWPRSIGGSTTSRHQLETEPYTFDRRFLFRVLSMGHSQFAELIGARGPNTQINSACASTTQAVALAEDWIRAGRCRRVVVVAADDATSDTLLGWIGAGFLASGAAATDEVVEDAALPVRPAPPRDDPRHGRRRARRRERRRRARARPDADLRGARLGHRQLRLPRDPPRRRATSARVMETARRPGRGARRRPRRRWRARRCSSRTRPTRRPAAAAPPPRSMRCAEVFGEDADRIVIANTKGFTGHPMGVGLEDVLAVKALETGVVPPVPNFREVDPDLGALNLSRGGAYPVRYALRLAAGFGSQIAMLLLRWTPVADGRRRRADELGYDYRIADRATSGRPGCARRGPRRSAARGRPAPAARRRLRHAPRLRGRADGAGRWAQPVEAARADRASRAGRRRARRLAPAPSRAPRRPRRAGAAAAPAGRRLHRGGRRRRGAGAGDRGRADGLSRRICWTWISIWRPISGSTRSSRPRCSRRSARRTGSSVTTSLKLRDYPTLNHVVGVRHASAPQRSSRRAARARAGAGGCAGAAAGRAAAVDGRRGAGAGDRGRADGLSRRICSTWISIWRPISGSTRSSRPRCSRRSARRTGSSVTTALKLRDYPTLNHVVGVRPRRAPADRRRRRPTAPNRRQPSDAGRPAADVAGADRLPAPRARRRAAPAARSGACRPASRSSAGSRVVLMPDGGGVGAALTERLEQARRRGRSRSRARRTAEALERSSPAGRPPGRSRASTGCPRSTTRARHALTRDWREALRVARQAAGGHHARARRARRRAGTFLVSRHAARRPPRLRRRTARPSVLGGAVTGFTKALARERPDALVKAVDFAPSGKTRRARRRCSSRRRCATRAPSRSATPTTCAGRSASSSEPRRARRRARADDGHRLPRHRRGRQHRVGDHRRPGRGVAAGRFHLLDLVARARPRRPRPRALRPTTAMGSSASSPSACATRGERADAEARRARAGADRARAARRSTRSRRSSGAGGARTGTRST